jgi:predicted O-methyltransferase YrrM
LRGAECMAEEPYNPVYPAPMPRSGIAAVDRYLDDGYERVVGMSSQFAAAVVARLMALQNEMGIKGPVAEIGTFEGRFFIAMAHALKSGEVALGMDLFDWPNPQVIDRFEANCARFGIGSHRRITWKVDSRATTADALLAKLGGQRPRVFHVDGEHSRHALKRDLALAYAVTAEDGIIVLDDMLHPGYPTLMVTVHEFLEANPDLVVLAIIDRETITGATKFVLCRRAMFKAYEERMLPAFKDNIWPLGADFEPHWCLVLSRDTRLANIT